MPHPAPSAEFQLEFLKKVEVLLAQGRFTSTYKFALLIALTNIAVERGDDTSDELKVGLDEIARQYLALYWNMARPYPRINAILKQNREANSPSRMITLLEGEARHSRSSFKRLRVYRASDDELVAETCRTLKRDVLYRLHATGGQSDSTGSDRFLYDRPSNSAQCAGLTHLVLKPGIAACLRRLSGVVVAMIQAHWALWLRKNNKELSVDRGLEQFLFVRVRSNVAIYAERLFRLQGELCFYTGAKLENSKSGQVDHFIPWARYPFDSPFNLVLASREANNKLRDQIKEPALRTKWLERNDAHFGGLTAPAPLGFGAATEDAETAKAISDWLYRTPA